MFARETAQIQNLVEGVIGVLTERRHGRLYLGGFLLRLLLSNLILGVDSLRDERLERCHLGKDGGEWLVRGAKAKLTALAVELVLVKPRAAVAGDAQINASFVAMNADRQGRNGLHVEHTLLIQLG